VAVISHFPRRIVKTERTTEHEPTALYLTLSPKFVALGKVVLLKVLSVSARVKLPNDCVPSVKRIGKITVTGAAVALPALVTEIAHSPDPANGVIC
jgi:hypothetical protein